MVHKARCARRNGVGVVVVVVLGDVGEVLVVTAAALAVGDTAVASDNTPRLLLLLSIF